MGQILGNKFWGTNFGGQLFGDQFREYSMVGSIDTFLGTNFWEQILGDKFLEHILADNFGDKY